jgi:RNA polymerase sigma factor (sigma-70 family)
MPIEPDEAISCALVGLVDAASRFDEERVDDGAFMSFAYPRIQGEIIDHVRRNGIVPRSEFAQGARAQMVSLDTVGVAADRDVAARPVAVVELSTEDDDPDLYIDLRSALSGLNERERYVVTAFATGGTGTEIAQELGISETRFWSILAVARAKLERDLAA